MSLIKAVSLHSISEEYPETLFFPKLHLGGNSGLLNHGGQFMLDKGAGLETAGEGMLIPILESSCRLIILTKRNSLLESIYPKAKDDDAEELIQKTLEKRGALPSEDEVYLEIHNGAIDIKEYTREKIRELMHDEVIDRVCDYLKITQIRQGEKAFHIREIQDSEGVLRERLILPEEVYPTLQEVQFIPLEPDKGRRSVGDTRQSGLIVSNNKEALEDAFEGLDYSFLEHQTFLNVCIKFRLPISVTMLCLPHIEVQTGMYNAADYKKELDQQMTKWLESLSETSTRR